MNKNTESSAKDDQRDFLVQPNDSENEIVEEYAKRLFDYTNILFQRTENRANYLFVANSIIAAAFFSILNLLMELAPSKDFMTTNAMSSISMILPAVSIGISVLLATRAILPIILDADIKLNQSYIASMTNLQYKEFLRSREPLTLMDDFIDEIHILSKILEIKNSRLNVAMYVFIFSFTMVCVGVVLLVYQLFYGQIASP